MEKAVVRRSAGPPPIHETVLWQSFWTLDDSGRGPDQKGSVRTWLRIWSEAYPRSWN